MNFFAHCLLAAKHSKNPKVWLGAMLPDFYGMAKIPRPEAVDGELQEGIQIHHATDKLFHSDEAFLAMLSDGARRLRKLAVRRGPARALSHVAIELHLDGLLSSDGHGEEMMQKALKVSLDGCLSFRQPQDEAALLRLIHRVATKMHPSQYQDAEIVHKRLVAIMSRRPRLALNPSEEAACQQVSEHLRSQVHAQGAQLYQRVNSSLGLG